MTFKCLECGEEFNEDEAIVTTYTQSHPYGEGYASEECGELLCPFCESEDVELNF
jgi:Zn finger protein HypA/HybF involved in hydrogenase expression